MKSTAQKQFALELKVDKLPSLPHVLVQLLDACHQNKASFHQISNIINQDTAIAAKVISLANSSFYRRGADVTSIERALLVLGTDTIKTIVITASIQQFFSRFGNSHLQFLKDFWRQSLACAHLAKNLAILTSYPDPDEAYLTGLLHNIGSLVIHTQAPNADNHHATPKHISIHQERDSNGLDHAQIGAWLMREWHLGQLAAEAIEFHHSKPELIYDAHHLTKIIFLASHVSDISLHSASDDLDLKHQIDQLNHGYELFELNAGLLFEIASKIQHEVSEIARGLDIKDEPQASDQDAQITLARYVRSIGLVQTVSTHLNQVTNLEGLHKAFKTTVELLFGYPHSLLFWFNAESNTIENTHSEDVDSKTFSIHLDNTISTVANTAISGEITCRLYDETSPDQAVIDTQICRQLNSAGIICLPIINADNLFGVLVLGCNEEISKNSNTYRLLSHFAAEVSTICRDTFSKIQEQKNEVSSEQLQLKAQEIAHEANNPLNIINNYLLSLGHKISQLGSDASAPLKVNEELAILREEVSRTSEIISRLSDLKKEAKHSEGVVDLNSEITDLCRLYENSLFLLKNIQCELDLDTELHEICGNKNQFKQIITNLIKNSCEALQDGGMIRISTAANVKFNGGNFAEITISDNGPGIPTEIKQKLFTPVQSTKGSNHSGLGLSITKNLVTDAKGTISCKSSKKGTSFQVFLPQIEANASLS